MHTNYNICLASVICVNFDSKVSVNAHNEFFSQLFLFLIVTVGLSLSMSGFSWVIFHLREIKL